MGKLPAFQFYPGDWIQDTRALSLATKGAWIDLLCSMWRSQTRGTLTLSMVGYSRLIGATVDQTASVIKELTDMQICDFVTHSNGDVTLINRRMAREEKERETTRCRVKRFRNAETKRLCNDDVTVPSSSSSSSSLKENIIKEKINFNFETHEWENLNGSHREMWRKAFPAINIDIQLARAGAWLVSNPSKKKSNYLKFLTKWMSNAQDRGGDIKSNSIQNHPLKVPESKIEPMPDLTPEQRIENKRRMHELFKKVGGAK